MIRLTAGLGLFLICQSLNVSADTIVFFGQDISPYPSFGINQVFRPLNLPKSNRAAAEFAVQLNGTLTETFEGYLASSIPTNIWFGNIRTPISGNESIGEMTDSMDTSLGAFPIAGSKALVMDPAVSTFLEFSFPSPQIAFGFFGTDLELNRLQISLINSNGISTNLLIPTTLQGTAGAFFYGVIDKTNPFSKVVLSFIGNAEDNIWLDNLMIAMPAQIIDPPQIIRQPLSQAVMVGEDTEFSIVATGSQPLRYQWYVNAQSILGATNSILHVSQITTKMAGSYYARVENAARTVESKSAVLSVYLPAIISGRVTDAVTGKLLPEVAVVIDNRQTFTDIQGYYAFSNIVSRIFKSDFNADPLYGNAPLRVSFTPQNLGEGLTLSASKTGYFPFTNNNIQIGPGESVIQNLTLSPANVAGMRLVLNWKERPRDLDAHLMTPDSGGTSYEVYYALGHRGNLNSVPYAQLDRDDTDGFGPETISISQVMLGTYFYYVHNYKEEQGSSGELTESDAMVSIYDEKGLQQNIYSPKQGSGDYWLVCAIDGMRRSVLTINQILSILPTNDWNSIIPISPEIPSTNRIATKYLWDFGDGTSSETENPVKIFNKPGIYSVILTSTFSHGVTDTEIKTNYITVLDIGPSLKIWREDADIVLGWTAPNYIVETCENLLQGSWTPLQREQISKQKTQYQIRTPIVMKQYFRLKKSE